MSVPASRFTDSICCAKDLMPGIVVAPCAAEVFIGGVAAARLTDLCACNHAHVAPIAEGAEMVLIHGMPAARVGVKLVDGGAVVTGDDSVLIGGATFAVPSFIKIDGDPAYQAKVIRDLYKISSTDSGKALLASMAQTGKRYRIGPTLNRLPGDPSKDSPNETSSDPMVDRWDTGKPFDTDISSTRTHPNAFNGEGVDAQTAYDPDHQPAGGGSPDTVLFHEMEHANDHMHGTMSTQKCKNDGGGWPVTPCSERRAVGLPPYDDKAQYPHSENDYREEVGYAPRKHY